MDIGIELASTKPKQKSSRIFRRLFFVLLILCFIASLILYRVQFKYSDKIVSPDELKTPSIGLVFGAGLKARGVPGGVLKDRIMAAIKLYQEGKVDKFIFSGDNSTTGHNEVQAMKNLAIDNGLPENIVLLDHAGVSTYDSCYRLTKVFGLSKIVLITQRYHLRRALYICNELDIDASGVVAEDGDYVGKFGFFLREWPASLKAWVEVNIVKPESTLD